MIRSFAAEVEGRMAGASRENVREFCSSPPSCNSPSSQFVYPLSKLREIGDKKCIGLPRAVKRKIFALKIRNKEHHCTNGRIFPIRSRLSRRRNASSRRSSRPPHLQVLRSLPRCDRHALSPSKCIMFGLFNIRSLNSKVDDLLELLRENKIDVLMVVETWHDHDSISLRRLRSDGFCVVDRPRTRLREDTLTTNHGGLAIVSIPRVSLRLLSLSFQPSTFECVCARVSYSSASCIQVLIYRTGSITSAFFDEISKLLESFVTFLEPIFVVGDFNVHIERLDPNSSQLRDIFREHDFQCCMEQPTHILGGTIDLIFSRNIDSIPTVSVKDTGISDHFLLEWKSSLQGPPPVAYMCIDHFVLGRNSTYPNFVAFCFLPSFVITALGSRWTVTNSYITMRQSSWALLMNSSPCAQSKLSPVNLIRGSTNNVS